MPDENEGTTPKPGRQPCWSSKPDFRPVCHFAGDVLGGGPVREDEVWVIECMSCRERGRFNMPEGTVADVMGVAAAYRWRLVKGAIARLFGQHASAWYCPGCVPEEGEE